MRTVDEYYKEMEVSMIRANVLESEEQTMARFLNGLNHPIKKIVEFQPYDSLVALVHQDTKAERQIIADFKYEKQRASFANKQSSSTPPMAIEPPSSTTKGPQRTSSATNRAPQAFKKATPQTTNQNATQVKSSSITCFKCGGSGHKSFECVNNKVMIVNAEGERDSMSEGEYYALHQVALNTLDMEVNEDETFYCDGDDQPSLVVTRVLTTSPQDDQDQRCNLFQTRAGTNSKSIKVIIDGGSCHNLASK